MKNKFNEMFKNKARLSLKLFILVWVVLLLQVVLKLTFNIWQPYVIPTPLLQAISNFVDNHFLLKAILNYFPYYATSLLMLLAGLQEWSPKTLKNFFKTVILVIPSTS